MQHFPIRFPHRDTTLQIIPSSESGYYKFLVKSDALTALLYGQTGRNIELHDCKMLYPWLMINVENRPHLASGLWDSSQIDQRQPLKAEQLRHQYVQKCDFDNSIWYDGSFSVINGMNVSQCCISILKKKSVALFTECCQQQQQKDWKTKENPHFFKLLGSL